MPDLQRVKMQDRQAPTTENSTTWAVEEWAKYKKLAKDMAAISPVTVYVEFYEDPNFFRIESFTAELDEFPGYSIVPPRYENVYRIYQHAIIDRAGKDYPENAPNKIGVPTKRKISEWVQYYEGRTAFFSNICQDRDEKIEAFKKRVTGASGEFRPLNGKFRADLSKGGIKYTAIIDPSTGYIEEKIELEYFKDKLTAFLKISNNSL